MGLKDRLRRLEELLAPKRKPPFEIILEDDVPSLEEDGNEREETSREAGKHSQS
jgi:hypothetical protein